MSIATDNRWVEQQISAGRLSPGARAMTPEDAARQYNEAGALTVADDGYLYTPAHAQEVVIAALWLVDVPLPPGIQVLLTDLDDTGPAAGTYRVNPGQVEAALDQYAAVTGENISTEALIAALPWAHEGEER